jgi:hypothetical protein
MISSMSAAATPACSSARFAASLARWLVNSPSAAMRRSRMPVREVIHSSDVSTVSSSSRFVMMRPGR